MARRSATRRHKQTPVWLQKDQLNRTLTWFGRGVLVVMLSVGSWRGYQWLMHPDTLPIRDVTVEGQIKHADVNELQAIIQSGIHGGFFSIDIDGVQTEIEAMPWVYRAAVRRKWPDRVTITVEEQAPIARWGDKGLLNRYGDIFVVDNPLERLPVISGPEGREKVLIEAFLRNDGLLRTVGLGLVGVQEDERHDQRLILDNGIKLALGRREQEERLRRFVIAYNHTLEGFVDRIEELDLRYSNGFSVSWKSEGSGLIGS